MANKDTGSRYSSLKPGQDDLKKHLCRLSDFVTVGVEDNINMASDVKHLVSDIRFLSNHIGFHDSRINDNDRDLKELMGTVDIIKDEVPKLV